jgi:hypothetical protein
VEGYESMSPYVVMSDPDEAPVVYQLLEILARVPSYTDVSARVKFGLELDLSRRTSSLEIPPQTAGASRSSPTRPAWSRSTYSILADHRIQVMSAVKLPVFNRAPSGPLMRKQADLTVFSAMPTVVGDA